MHLPIIFILSRLHHGAALLMHIKSLTASLISPFDHAEEFVFVDDGDAEGAGFFQLRRTHIGAGKHIVGLFGDRSGVLPAVALD